MAYWRKKYPQVLFVLIIPPAFYSADAQAVICCMKMHQYLVSGSPRPNKLNLISIRTSNSGDCIRHLNLLLFRKAEMIYQMIKGSMCSYNRTFFPELGLIKYLFTCCCTHVTNPNFCIECNVIFRIRRSLFNLFLILYLKNGFINL